MSSTLSPNPGDATFSFTSPLVKGQSAISSWQSRLGQPSVSKHLKVLHNVGLVHYRRDGRRMLYRTNVEALRPVRDWAETFERFWNNQLLRVKESAEAKGGKP